MSTPEDEEYFRSLGDLFNAERWHTINGEMFDTFKQWLGKYLPDRVAYLYEEVAPQIGLEGVSAVSYAYAQAMAEGTLAAVSHYLATHEAH